MLRMSVFSDAGALNSTEHTACLLIHETTVKMSDEGSDNSDQDSKLLRPRAEFQTLLHLAGATKDLYTMKEVMYYLGQYIMQKQLYDQTQQHMVHCAHDPLGLVLGVHSFSVKEPRVLFSLITKNLVAVRSNESSPDVSQNCDGQTEEESVSSESTRRRRRRRMRSSEPGPPGEEQEEEEQEEDDERKRRRSDSFSLTFDDSLSWCVIGGLRNDTDCHAHSSDTHSTVSDNFSVEFEVESLDSEDYSDEDTSVSADDQVYEVTIYEAEEDSSDEDTEITQADYWQCSKCEEWNPPLPRNCNRCWELRQDWLPELSVSKTNSASSDPKVLPPKPPVDQSAAYQHTCPGGEENEGVDVPDGKRSHSLPSSSPPTRLPSPPPPSSSSSKLLGPASPPLPSSSPCDPADPPDPERSVSMESRLPDSCLEPCVICQTRPKNGCIVHGRTGHLMACYSCAKKLKKRNKPCPMCREPIQSVVLTYHS
ncbi:hypothetical protein CRUP_013324 [Coryphaenoides rupestris]|nr:hypothetical protein CRUP_013324 [Coryphaenoides rupestris]